MASASVRGVRCSPRCTSHICRASHPPTRGATTSSPVCASGGAVALDDPPLLVVCPTVADPTRAPDGGHTLKIIGFHPYTLADGGPERWEDVKHDVSRANLEQLRRYAPNLTDETILATLVKSPVDLEALNEHIWRGSCHGGEMSPAQSGGLRPAPGWAEHRLPIAGLYQTGSATHPRASVSPGPGRHA